MVAKLLILASAIMKTSLGPRDVDRMGISHLSVDDIQQAKQSDQRWKLIGRLDRRTRQVLASVKPQPLPMMDPLAQVGGVTNALTFDADRLGPVTIIGPGAGRLTTGCALLSDIIAIQLPRAFTGKAVTL